MGNLLDTIKISLNDLHMIPWLPALTALLTKKGWETLHRRTGITALDYGTARVLAGESYAPRHVVACLPICPDQDEVIPRMLTEVLTRRDMHRYRDMGLTFYTSDELLHSSVIECLQESIALLTHVPTLQETVARLVRNCHILKPQDDDYDVSHSDPQVPFSIFVSVPQRRTPHDALRVAESIVHEAMHLQLTLLEQTISLVHATDRTYYSPWKEAYRSPQGVLHALYVFRVIDRCLDRLQTLPVWSATDASYMRNRRDDIARQIGEIEIFKDCPELTPWGTDMVHRLMLR